MPLLSAVDSINPAFERVKDMLFRPFRLKTWLTLGFIGWLAAGGTASTANFNFSLPPSFPSGGQGTSGVDPGKALGEFIRSLHLSEHIPLIATMAALIALTIIAFFLAFLYLFCRFRFILFDSVLCSDPNIERGWYGYGRPAHRYLGFWILYTLISWGAIAVIVGVPLWRAYKSGVFAGSDFPFSLFRIMIPVLLGVGVFAIVSGIVSSLANDFVIPLMALEDLTVGRAWSRLKDLISSEPGAWAGYLGMKLLLLIAAGMITSVTLLICFAAAFIVLLIPAIIIVLVIVGAVKSLGAVGLILGIILGTIAILALLVLLFTVTLLSIAPTAAFFTAYPLYFFGGRYPKLGAILWPAPPPPPSPPPPLAAPAPAT
jgi:hypothetical protein